MFFFNFVVSTYLPKNRMDHIKLKKNSNGKKIFMYMEMVQNVDINFFNSN